MLAILRPPVGTAADMWARIISATELSPEATEYLVRRRCDVVLLPTPNVIAAWNEAKGKVIGLFHVTC